MEFVGIVHNTRKFESSFTQSIINKKIKNYLMLSDNLVKSITPARGLNVDFFYPLRFASKLDKQVQEEKIVAIIGGVERRRKDLDGFIELAKQVKDQNVRFMFLGKSNFELEEVRVFYEKLGTNGLTKMVTTYDDFIDQELFDAMVQNADVILPLVHPNTQSAEEYFKIRMSGAMCVSFGYKVPMLLHEGYEHIEEMQAASFYYTLDSFKENLQTALDQSKEKAEAMKHHDAYQLEFQEKKYLEFVLG
jgi:hypothetical protein